MRPVIAGADIVELIGDPPHVWRILLELIYKHFDPPMESRAMLRESLRLHVYVLAEPH